MTKFWLKLIGSAEKPCPEEYQCSHADLARRPRRIQEGDEMIFYAAGGSKRVFAQVRVASRYYERDDDRWPYRINVECLIRLPVSCGADIEKIDATGRLRRAIPRATYFELSEEEYDRAIVALQEARTRISETD